MTKHYPLTIRTLPYLGITLALGILNSVWWPGTPGWKHILDLVAFWGCWACFLVNLWLTVKVFLREKSQ